VLLGGKNWEWFLGRRATTKRVRVQPPYTTNPQGYWRDKCYSCGKGGGLHASFLNTASAVEKTQQVPERGRSNAKERKVIKQNPCYKRTSDPGGTKGKWVTRSTIGNRPSKSRNDTGKGIPRDHNSPGYLEEEQRAAAEKDQNYYPKERPWGSNGGIIKREVLDCTNSKWPAGGNLKHSHQVKVQRRSKIFCEKTGAESAKNARMG